MFKLVILLFIIFSTSSFSQTFTPIGKTKYFPPVPYTNTAMNAGKLRGAVTIGNAFAIAKIKPSSALALGKQLAKANPYTMAAMLALGYFQDDIGQWMASPSEDTYPIKTPRSMEAEVVNGVTNVGFNYLIGGSVTDLDVNALCEGMYPESDLKRNSGGSWEQKEIVEQGIIWDAKCTYDQWDNWGGAHYVQTVVVSVFLASTSREAVKSCPPDGYNQYQFEIRDEESNDLTGCANPAEMALTQDSQLPLKDAAPVFADDLLTQRQHQALDDLSKLETWQPFTDPATGNIEPEYIESYNKPVMSPEFNSMMISVADGTNQSNDANAPNYVPADMLYITQSAVTAAMNDNPFVDPTTSQVVEPNTSVDGAATQAPAPDGSVNAPFNITLDIPEDDTISQTEYEASNAKFFEQFASASADSQANVDSGIEALKTQDSDFIDSLTPDVIDAGGIPAFPSIADLWGIGGGSCVPYTSNSSIAGVTKTIVYDKHCPTYNEVVHPLVVWFLYVSTALYIIHLAGRTFKSTVS